MRHWATITALLLATVGAGGCGTPTQAEVGGDRNGSQVSLQRGQTLVVTLESNPTTGYRWEVADVDTSILEQVGEAVFTSSAKTGSPMVGAGGTETFRFRAAKTGQTTLTMVYRRSWETGVAPLKTYTLQIMVR